MKKTLIENQLSLLTQLRDDVGYEVFHTKKLLGNHQMMPSTVAEHLECIHEKVNTTVSEVIDGLTHFRRVLGADVVNKATYRYQPEKSGWACNIYFTKDWEPFSEMHFYEESVSDEYGVPMPERGADDLIEFIQQRITCIIMQYQLTELSLDEIPIVKI